MTTNICARAWVAILGNVFLHPSHLDLNGLIIKFELLMELFRVDYIPLVLFKSSSKFLEVERVLQLLLSFNNLSIFDL